MDSIFILLLVWTVSSLDQVSTSCDCEEQYAPVCGSDNNVYSNMCKLRCAEKLKPGLDFYYNGTCCEEPNCSKDVIPVCDNLGTNYNNSCEFARVACLSERTLGIIVKKREREKCQNLKCNRLCPKLISPVCDSSGKVYDNICKFQQARCRNQNSTIILARDEKFCLRKPTAPPKRNVDEYQEYDPNVEFSPLGDNAGSDNRTLLESITGASKLPHLTILNVPEACSSSSCDFTVNPVCDTNNRTHSNVCYFKYHACLAKQNDVTVELAYMGACNKLSKVCLTCPKDEDKISLCDNLNTTHHSLCSFIQFNCQLHNIGEPERVLVHIKPCHERSPQFHISEEICPEGCSTDWKPVCDEANNTHQNLCSFQKNNCNLRKLGIRPPYLRYLKACSKIPVLKFENSNDTLHLSTNVVTSLARKTQTAQPTHEKTTVLISSFEYPIRKGFTDNLLEATTKSVLTTTDKILRETSTTSTTESPKMTSTTEALTTTTTSEIPVSTTTETREVENFETSEETSGEVFSCPQPNCPIDGQPVCDSKGNLHGNLCEFTHWRCLAAQIGEQVRIANEENCVSPKACQSPCTEESHPICASDFNTYKNLCIFRKHKCQDAELEVLFKGTCNECFAEPCKERDDAPDEAFVCMEDGSTKSLCEYQMLSCIFEKGYGVNLTIQYLGRCCPSDDLCDIEHPNPQCGSNGVTYFSQCEIDVENCRNGKLDLPMVVIEKHGVCDTQKPSIFVEKHFNEEAMIDVTTGEFMSLMKEEKFTGETFNCTEECSKTYDPVCGFNDVTYSNLCMMMQDECSKKSSIGVSYNGTCCNSECQNNFSPVCDSEGDTHQNLCYFGLKRCIMERTTGKELIIDKFDVCSIVLECDDECPKEFSPICASNGETIINECELNRINCLLRNNIMSGDSLTKIHDGKCCPRMKCSFDFLPVCDSEGITHANECIFERHSCTEEKVNGKHLSIAYNGSCCSADCDDDYHPVCDGTVTYKNMCHFRIAQCEADRSGSIISFAHDGECCDLPVGECALSGPVCDSDNVTHEDECLFLQHKCFAEKAKSPLDIAYRAECCKSQTCTDENSPVCDSEGHTHKNKCEFLNSKCRFDRKFANRTLELDYEGKCCTDDCEDKVEIVCDQQGKRYLNSCRLQKAACESWARTQSILKQLPCTH